MTLARKGSRNILVDGVGYRWKVRHRPTYSQGLGSTRLSYVVEQAERSGSLLVVTVPWAHPGNWVGLESAAIRPAMVAEAIRAARAIGWHPTLPGPAFALANPSGLATIG
jgi:hypothetical protein